ncbi:branched-chain amino acid ABC transporter permease [uncultured Castellaniella sp.]|uniref:branched-chain amino acid ABC transporter permease n=1 Tax=uncultured Castellaniella sp. TaxID=647907 RepID=UPI0026192C8B|nr:branched-chain amino acid ABC transporter permease [uncultured Castellaniella sp.]
MTQSKQNSAEMSAAIPASVTPPASAGTRFLRVLGPVLWIVGLAIPSVMSPAWITIGGIFAIYAIVALSQDIVLGRAGMYDMGHAVFFGIGAYTSAILSLSFNWPILWTIPVAIVLSAALGAILSAPIVKLRGDYLLVVTIGFNAIFVLAMKNNLFGLTGGADGLFGVSGPTLFGHMFGTQSDLFYLNWVVLAIVLWLMRNLDRSSLGRTFRYIKYDELAATTLGVNARNYKVAAFALSAGVAGLAGTLFAMQLSAVSPGSFQFTDSVVLFAIVLVGGQASVPGVLLGTAMMFVVPQIFTEFAQYRYLVFGIAMILVMILRPQGIWPARKGAL